MGGHAAPYLRIDSEGEPSPCQHSHHATSNAAQPTATASTQRLLPTRRPRYAAWGIRSHVRRAALIPHRFIDVAAKRQLALLEQGQTTPMWAANGRASLRAILSLSASAKASTSSSPARDICCARPMRLAHPNRPVKLDMGSRGVAPIYRNRSMQQNARFSQVLEPPAQGERKVRRESQFQVLSIYELRAAI